MLSTPIHYRPATPKESPMNMECIVGSIRCASGSASSPRASRSQKGRGPVGSVPGRGRGATSRRLLALTHCWRKPDSNLRSLITRLSLKPRIHLISHRRKSQPVLVPRREPYGFPVILDSAIGTKPRRGTRSLSPAQRRVVRTIGSVRVAGHPGREQELHDPAGVFPDAGRVAS
jgi:hypothetical protein